MNAKWASIGWYSTVGPTDQTATAGLVIENLQPSGFNRCGRGVEGRFSCAARGRRDGKRWRPLWCAEIWFDLIFFCETWFDLIWFDFEWYHYVVMRSWVVIKAGRKGLQNRRQGRPGHGCFHIRYPLLPARAQCRWTNKTKGIYIHTRRLNKKNFRYSVLLPWPGTLTIAKETPNCSRATEN